MRKRRMRAVAAKRPAGLAVGLAAGLVLSGCGAATAFGDRGQLVAEPAVCAPTRFEVYFTENDARLTPAARQVVDLNAERLRGCDIRRVRVLGLADATGTPEANLTLSQRRARTVAAALVGDGWPTPAFELDAAGDAGAVAASGAHEPLRRRTEVVIDAAPR